VQPGLFLQALKSASADNARINSNVEPYTREQLSQFKTFLSYDGLSGFAIKPDGELTAVFSAVKCRGEALVAEAISLGASHLNCFDGYLTALYGKAGFQETKRVPNWNIGGPDVVFMKIA